MGNRCDSCSKFVGLDMAEPEVQSTEIASVGGVAEDGTQEVEVGASVDLGLTCQDCGGDMGTVSVEGEATVTLVHSKIKREADDLEIEETGVEQSEDFRPPGRPARYQKHFYGAEVGVKVTCNKCQAEVEGTIQVEAQASEFDQ